ncbi:helix-turn-helix domain-containing protein [Streptomyces sp. NPDC056503]|uniref:helix-turn-helix domain-containing protein n=1 Tax=Streptomyces sp. NPDC056503 TaxID=3345842 RepID=UPI0036A529ED
MEVSRRLRITPDTVRTWRRRFIERGLDGLCDDPRPGVPRKITDADVERVIVKTLEETPKNATTGRPGRWPRPRVRRSRPSRGSGGRSPWHRTGRSRLRCRRTRCSSTRSAMSSVCISTAGEGACSLRGREVADPGLGPVPARPADGARHS